MWNGLHFAVKRDPNSVASGAEQHEIISQIDKYLVILSSKTYVFEDKMSKC